MNQHDIDQLRRDLLAWEKQRDGFYRAQRWTDVAAMDRRIAIDSAKLEAMENQSEMSG